jgi:aspartokinase
VASAECYRTVRDIILEAQASNPKMAVVVSAMGGKPKVCGFVSYTSESLSSLFVWLRSTTLAPTHSDHTTLSPTQR